MSNKMKTTGGNEDSQAALVPKLRFPEFRDAGAWKVKRMDEIADVVASGDLDVELFSPVRTAQHIFEVYSNAVTQEGLYGFYAKSKYEKNSVTITARGTLGIAFSRNQDFMGIGRLLVLSKLKNVDAYFLKESWNYSADIPHENGGIPQLTAIKTKAIVLKIPDPEEQQKIADCLSSLDELIAAQARKVAALKTHKKGLMQQLFPREGETQPRLRFSEFLDAGKWVREELSSCLEKVIDYRGKAPPKSEAGVPLITARNVRFGWLDMSIDEYIEADDYESWMSKGIPTAGDILFTTEAPLGNVALFPSAGKFALGQRIITLRTIKTKCLPEFLFQSLLGPQMQKAVDFHSTGSTAKGIKSTVFVTIGFCHPGLEEQQRIADCLTSLDDLITAQTQELEALKTHKKALMQQLFPTAEAVEA